jgi:hypothetical protein
MKKFSKAVKEYKYFKFRMKLKNTHIVYDDSIKNYIVFINWSKDYLINNYHFTNVY